MTTWRDFYFRALLRKAARRFLLPLLRALGLKRGLSPQIPHISARDRLQDKDVPSKVSLRTDQTIMLNGLPFFPIGLYYAECEMEDETGTSLRQLRATGFNTIFFRGGLESESLLDLIWSAGLHVCYRPPGELYREYELLKQVVSEFGRHPALLFWEMDDEPVLNRLKLSDVAVGIRIVRAIDPYHPIACNQWLSSTKQADDMRMWGRLADVYGFSVYPIPLRRWNERLSLLDQGWPHSIAVVGKQTDLWKSYAPNKPIIPVLQAWAWDCLEDGHEGYPTYQEGRFMAYQAVIHGAKGLHYYGATSANRANFACGIPPRIHEDLDRTHSDFVEARRYNQWFWDYYSKLINELSRMSEVFACSDSVWFTEVHELGPRPYEARAEYRVKRYKDSAVILVANPCASPLTIEIRSPEMAGCTIELWGTGKSMKLDSEGRFEDVLEPYGIRIYSDQHDLLEASSPSNKFGVQP